MIEFANNQNTDDCMSDTFAEAAFAASEYLDMSLMWDFEWQEYYPDLVETFRAH